MPNRRAVIVLGARKSQATKQHVCYWMESSRYEWVLKKRLNHVKGWSGFPTLTVRKVLCIAGL